MKINTEYLANIGKTIEYLIGQNAQDNFDIITMSKSKDLWFHINDQSSCHVIAKIDQYHDLSKKELYSIIKRGSLLCKSNSKYKNKSNVAIKYAYLEFVKKTDTIGKVSVSQHKIIYI